MSLGFYIIPTGTIQSYIYWRYHPICQRWLHGGSYIGFIKLGVGLRYGFKLDAPCSNPTTPLARLSYVGPCGKLLWRGRCIFQHDWPTGFLPSKYEELFQLGGRISLSCCSFGPCGHQLLGKMVLLSLCKNNVMFHWILIENSSGISSRIICHWHRVGRIYLHESMGLSGTVRYQLRRHC